MSVQQEKIKQLLAKREDVYKRQVEKALPKLLAGDPYWACASNLGAAFGGTNQVEDFPVHPLVKGRTGQALEVMTNKGVPLFGKAVSYTHLSGRGGRKFESSHPDSR